MSDNDDHVRICNGGPDAPGCGRHATVVCWFEDRSIGWWACEDHTSGAVVKMEREEFFRFVAGASAALQEALQAEQDAIRSILLDRISSGETSE